MADSKKAAQRREAVRVEALIPIYFHVLKHDVQAAALQPPNMGSSINLSSTGMLLACDRELAEGSRLMLSFRLLAGEEEVFTEASVLSTQPQQEGAIKKFLCHLRFEPTDPEFAHRVTRFVNHRQLQLRRQGLI